MNPAVDPVEIAVDSERYRIPLPGYWIRIDKWITVVSTIDWLQMQRDPRNEGQLCTGYDTAAGIFNLEYCLMASNRKQHSFTTFWYFMNRGKASPKPMTVSCFIVIVKRICWAEWARENCQCLHLKSLQKLCPSIPSTRDSLIAQFKTMKAWGFPQSLIIPISFGLIKHSNACFSL